MLNAKRVLIPVLGCMTNTAVWWSGFASVLFVGNGSDRSAKTGKTFDTCSSVYKMQDDMFNDLLSGASSMANVSQPSAQLLYTSHTDL
jgi:hypothetical protein